MIDFLLAEGNLPFTIALTIMVGIALLEGVGTLLGFGSSAAHTDMDAHPGVHLDAPHGDVDVHVDHPELHAGDTDLDHDLHADAHDASALGKLLAWLGLGKLPAMVWLVVFLTSFGLTGLVLQMVIRDFAGGLLPWGAAAPIALFLCLPVVRVGGGLLARILPRDETSAVPAESFVGQLAVVTLGTARRGQPAEAKLRDRFGKTHYVLVEPEGSDDELETGSQVLLVSRAGAVFAGVRNPYETVIDPARLAAVKEL